MWKRIAATLLVCQAIVAVANAQTAVDLREAAKAAMPATVAIKIDGSGAEGTARADRLWRRSIIDGTRPQTPFDTWVFREMNPAQQQWRSGFAVSPNLLISMDIPSSSDELEVYAGRDKMVGAVVGRDMVTGLVAIRVQPSDALGELAIGLEPASPGLPVGIAWQREGQHKTLVAGMIAGSPGTIAAVRGYTQALDSDVSSQAIGAPIVDAGGTLVGVVCFTDEGKALSLPADQVNRLLKAITDKEEPVVLTRGRLGIALGEDGRSVVTQVMAGTPAHDADLVVRDQIVKVGDYDTVTNGDVLAAVAMFRGGDRVNIAVQRGEDSFEKTVTLEAIPAEQDPFAFRAQPTQIAPLAPRGPAFKIEDGKLLPFDPESGTVIEDEARRMQDLRVPWTQPRELRSFEVERSRLEQAMREQRKQLQKLQDKIDALQTRTGRNGRPKD